MQPNGPTIQAELQEAFRQILGETLVVEGSGRTDSGVHALGQVAAASVQSALPLPQLQKALNAVLPTDIRVRDLAETDLDFDPVRSAKRKLYRYLVQDGHGDDPFGARFAWRVRADLDVAAMNGAARAFEGTHDFRCFETHWPNRVSSVRTVYRCRATRFGEYVAIDVEANGFLYNMVRAMTGTLVQVGKGKRSAADAARLLEIPPAEGSLRAAAGPTAPAHGLYLVRVDYD
jgi:tRNA pseudouridine38-40 synthase